MQKPNDFMIAVENDGGGVRDIRVKRLAFWSLTRLARATVGWRQVPNGSQLSISVGVTHFELIKLESLEIVF